MGKNGSEHEVRKQFKNPDGTYKNFIDPEGNVVVVLFDEDGRPQLTRTDKAVASAFLGPQPPGTKLIHIDGDLTNCHADNLKYVEEEAP